MKNIYKKLSLLALLCVASVPCAQAMDRGRSSRWFKAGLVVAGVVGIAYCYWKMSKRSHPKKSFLKAVYDGDLKAVRWWIKNGADVNQQTDEGHTVLHLAASGGHVDVVRCLVTECEADVNQQTDGGLTALHLAASDGQIDVVRCLVTECEADVNQQTDGGLTALQLAASDGQIDVVRCLVTECEADVNQQADRGLTALHLATTNGHIDVVRCLVAECEADVNQQVNGFMALHVAAICGHEAIVRCLVKECEVDVDQANRGWTALHLAADKGDIDVVRCLVGQGAKIGKRTKGNETALIIAQQNNHASISEFLKKEILRRELQENERSSCAICLEVPHVCNTCLESGTCEAVVNNAGRQAVVLENCCHNIMCSQCFATLQAREDKCPMCRSDRL